MKIGSLKGILRTEGWVKDTVIAAACLGMFACFVSPSDAAERSPLKIGDPPPRFTLAGLDGKTVTVPDDLAGKAVVIHFWADWCPYCVDEMPVLESLYRQYRQQGLVIYAVNVGQGPKEAKAFVDRVRVTYPVLLDREGTTAKQYNVLGLPRTFFLDRKGRIKYKLLGEASEDMLRKLIEKTL
jgi:cytochrome c biogenesis protein CcmG/thiol:disulfide interchange protein DsbE